MIRKKMKTYSTERGDLSFSVKITPKKTDREEGITLSSVLFSVERLNGGSARKCFPESNLFFLPKNGESGENWCRAVSIF